MTTVWKVSLSKKAKKQYKKLFLSGLKKPSIIDLIDALVIDLEKHGPNLVEWPNYGTINENKNSSYFHCHLKKGRPTFVACWKIISYKERIIEVFYVGSHEDSPY